MHCSTHRNREFLFRIRIDCDVSAILSIITRPLRIKYQVLIGLEQALSVPARLLCEALP